MFYDKIVTGSLLMRWSNSANNERERDPVLSSCEGPLDRLFTPPVCNNVAV